jgi:hypothetical protein
MVRSGRKAAQSELNELWSNVTFAMLQNIRLVTFDALHTLITPRVPVYVQYSQVFTPYIGTLPPESIKRSFKGGEPLCLTSGGGN